MGFEVLNYILQSGAALKRNGRAECDTSGERSLVTGTGTSISSADDIRM